MSNNKTVWSGIDKHKRTIDPEGTGYMGGRWPDGTYRGTYDFTRPSTPSNIHDIMPLLDMLQEGWKDEAESPEDVIATVKSLNKKMSEKKGEKLTRAEKKILSYIDKYRLTKPEDKFYEDDKLSDYEYRLLDNPGLWGGEDVTSWGEFLTLAPGTKKEKQEYYERMKFYEGSDRFDKDPYIDDSEKWSKLVEEGGVSLDDILKARGEHGAFVEKSEGRAEDQDNMLSSLIEQFKQFSPAIESLRVNPVSSYQEGGQVPNNEDLSSYFSRISPGVYNRFEEMAKEGADKTGPHIRSLVEFLTKPAGFKGSHELLSTQDNAHSQIDELMDSNDMKEQLSSFLDAMGKSTYPMSPNKMPR